MTFDPWADEPGPAQVQSPSGDLRLLAIEFDDPLKAQEALLASLRLAGRGAIRLDDAAIVTKERSGRIRIHQTKDTSPGQGAAAGGWVGMLAGLLFMAPLVGAVLGAAVGGIWAKLRDIGISDRQMAAMGETLERGHAALFLLMVTEAPTTLVRELRRFDGSILFSSLAPDLTAEIAAALDEIV